jgi:large subunit ribosomal protein L25
MVPAIIYGHGEEPEPITLPEHDLRLQIEHGAHLLHVDLAGAKAQYLIKEIQYDHMGTALLHVDLARVRMDERVEVRVPLDFRGTPKGAQESGAIFTQQRVDLRLECLVTNIPEKLKVRVEELAVGQAIHARDVELPEGVKLVTDGDVVVCAVQAKAVAEVAEEEAAPAEAGEPEVIARGKEEGEEQSAGESGS